MNRDASTTSSSWSRTNLRKAAMRLLHRRLRPEAGRQRLLGGPRRARARADLLDLVVVACPALAVERRRPVGPELVGGVEAERPHQAEVGADRRRRRGRDPDAGDRRVRRRVGHRSAEAVVGTHGDDEGGDAPRRRPTPSVFAWPSGIVGQRGGVRRIEDRRRLRRQVVDENAVGGRGHAPPRPRRPRRASTSTANGSIPALRPPSPSRRPRSPRRRRSRGLRSATAPPR